MVCGGAVARQRGAEEEEEQGVALGAVVRF
jgi:hypothetical protein